MSTRSTASSGVSNVITPQIRHQLDELEGLLTTIMNTYYPSQDRDAAAQEANDIIFALEQYKRGAMLNTSMYISSRRKVTKHPEQIRQRTEDTKKLNAAINNARIKIENQTLMGEIEALNAAIQAAINADNQEAFDNLKRQIFDKIDRIGRLNNIEHRDRMIILSNFDKSLSQLESHGQNREAIGDSLAAVSAANEALAKAQTKVIQFNFSLLSYVNRGLTSMFNVAQGAAYMFLGATRGAVLGVRAVASSARDMSRSNLVNELAAYGSAALQTTALAISNMLKDNNIPVEQRNQLEQQLQNLDPELARLIIGVPMPNNTVVDPNLLIAQAAFDAPGSASSSIASSLVPSRAASAAASPAASQQEVGAMDLDILAPTLPALTQADVDALEMAITISRSSSRSSASSVTIAQSITSGMEELHNFRTQIASIQQQILREQGEQGEQIEVTREAIDIEIDINEFTFEFGVDNFIDNAPEVSQNFLEAVEPNLQHSASANTSLGVDMNEVAMRLGDAKKRGLNDEEEDEEKALYGDIDEAVKKTRANTDEDLGGGRRRKSRYHKKSKKSKRRQQKGGKHVRKTMRRHKRRTMKHRK